MSVRLERVALGEVPWGELDVHPERSIFQTQEWLAFLQASQRGEPVVARVLHDDRTIGWFSGAIVRRMGLRLLGSPMPGWTTSYMGFVLDRPELRQQAVPALRAFAFDDLRCVHLELMDRQLDVASSWGPGAASSIFHSFELELGDDATMLARMSQGARRNIRRAESEGVVVEAVDPAREPGFAAEYHAQVSQSFAKRNRAPTYDVQRVQSLIDHLHPSGRLLLLRARTPSGRSAATGIFPGLVGATAVFWMGASDQELLHLRPNEALMWHAIRTWRDRGAARFDFGGGGSFKPKFGGTPIEVPWIRWSRFAVLEHGRSAGAVAARATQRLRAVGRSRPAR